MNGVTLTFKRHVEYAEHNAVYSLTDGEVLEGQLPSKQPKLLVAWI
jgi:nitrite reductase/ring-hydroxylating ferredoxin subunit